MSLINFSMYSQLMEDTNQYSIQQKQREKNRSVSAAEFCILQNGISFNFLKLIRETHFGLNTENAV